MSSFSTFNTPFAMGMATSAVMYNGIGSKCVISTEPMIIMPEHLDLKILEGRWYNKSDGGMKETPVVLTSH